MTHWTPAELHEFDSHDEIHLSSHRADGSDRPFVTMWTVRVQGDVVVRSARHVNPWFTRALAAGTGRIRVGSIDRDVTFEPFEGDGAAIDAAYHDKYDRYGDRIVRGVVGEDSFSRTIRVTPAY